MESNGQPLRIHISKETNKELQSLGGYITEERGMVAMKGKGDVLTYWLVGTTENAIKKRAVDDHLKLQPLFAPNRFGDASNVESPRRGRRSPHMSLMITNNMRQSLRKKSNTTETSDSTDGSKYNIDSKDVAHKILTGSRHWLRSPTLIKSRGLVYAPVSSNSSQSSINR